MVTAPVAITVWLTWWFVSLFDQWIKPVLPAIYNPDTYLPFSVPGVGILVSLIVITLIGALAANFVGKTVLGYWENFLDRMPIIRGLYRGIKQIFQTAVSQSGTNFKQVGMIEYPRKGVHVVVFIARELDSGDIGRPPGTTLYSAFMPTTPNPTSGFLFFLEKKEVTILDITVEEGAKLVISAGLVTPADQQGIEIDQDEVDALLAKKPK